MYCKIIITSHQSDGPIMATLLLFKQGLKMAGLGLGLEVHIKEIPVKLYDDSKGNVVIHLGIAPGAKCITLEQTGKNHCYKNRDVSGLCPDHHCCIEEGPERLDSIIDMRSLSNKLTTCRYLCDFVYYYSLYHGQGKAALIHVPASGSLASPEKLVPQLQTIIQALLRQLDCPEHTTSGYVDSKQVENTEEKILHKT
uniref:Pyroglutamyl-peptidase I like n=1 Tax=Sinocyclocheilus anshuiensis TaxID=1608454 RepID=A0A671NY03_9TELE